MKRKRKEKRPAGASTGKQQEKPFLEEIPYFARRVSSPAFLALAGTLSFGRDSTDLISEDRDAR
jgi:hypothetical protein